MEVDQIVEVGQRHGAGARAAGPADGVVELGAAEGVVVRVIKDLAVGGHGDRRRDAVVGHRSIQSPYRASPVIAIRYLQSLNTAKQPHWVSNELCE